MNFEFLKPKPGQLDPLTKPSEEQIRMAAERLRASSDPFRDLVVPATVKAVEHQQTHRRLPETQQPDELYRVA